MSKRRNQELREMTIEELEIELDDLSKTLLDLRIRHTTRELENSINLRTVRRDVARVRTIINEHNKGIRHLITHTDTEEISEETSEEIIEDNSDE